MGPRRGQRPCCRPRSRHLLGGQRGPEQSSHTASPGGGPRVGRGPRQGFPATGTWKHDLLRFLPVLRAEQPARGPPHPTPVPRHRRGRPGTQAASDTAFHSTAARTPTARSGEKHGELGFPLFLPRVRAEARGGHEAGKRKAWTQTASTHFRGGGGLPVRGGHGHELLRCPGSRPGRGREHLPPRPAGSASSPGSLGLAVTSCNDGHL